MKIVFLNPSGELGGAERVLISMLRSLRKARPDWSFAVVASEEGPLVPAVRELGFEVRVLQMPAALAGLGEASSSSLLDLVKALPAVWSYRSQVRALLRGMRPDVLHCNGFKMHLLGTWSRPPGAILVWHLHEFLLHRGLVKRLLRMWSGRVSAIVAISRSVGEDVKAVVKKPERVHIVLNAIDLEHFSPAGPVQELQGSVTVGLFATFARWKGHDVFLRAIAMLPRDIQAYVVGGSVYRTAGSQYAREELERRAEELGIGDRVTFLGFVRDPAPLMRGIDIVVHASTEPEPFGLVIAEAMGCGRAVIVSLAGGAAELVSPGVNGLAHQPGDATGLAAAVRQFASDPELRREYGAAARKAAELLFREERFARELIAVYEA